MIKGSNFFVINLPKNLVTILGTERFEFVRRVEIEQGFINVEQVRRNVSLVVTNEQIVVMMKIERFRK